MMMSIDRGCKLNYYSSDFNLIKPKELKLEIITYTLTHKDCFSFSTFANTQPPTPNPLTQDTNQYSHTWMMECVVFKTDNTT